MNLPTSAPELDHSLEKQCINRCRTGQDSRGQDSAVDVTEARARELHMKKQERDSNGSFNCHIEAMPGEQHRFVELLSHGLVDKRY